MFSRSLSLFLIVTATICQARVLRVCADPNNLPFSNQAGEGLENKLASIVAADLKADLEIVWWSERKSFVKSSLGANKCDVILGIASNVPDVLFTRPYYRSTYVFLSRKDRNLHVQSLADPSLDNLRIGVHVVGDDYAPPAHALAQRGLSANLKGFSLFGGFGEPNPAAKLIQAVANGDVDIGIVWGPFAGYFARHSATSLETTAVMPPMWMGIPFTYEIAMAVRPGATALQNELNNAITHRCSEIRTLLAEYGFPVLSQEQELSCDGLQQPSVSSR